MSNTYETSKNDIINRINKIKNDTGLDGSYVIFRYTAAKGWIFVDSKISMRCALEFIGGNAQQTTSYCIYKYVSIDVPLCPNLKDCKFDVLELVRNIAGKNDMCHKTLDMQWAIKNKHMPWLFTNELFEYN